MDGSEYFWADARPGYKYADHPEGLMTMLDQGKNLWVLIQKESASAYYVQLDSLNGPFFYDGNSSPNDREADNIYEGLEVSGGGGASAPRADFTQNQWFDPLNKEHYEPTAQGTYFPIFSTQRVGATANSTGGDWWTSCCKP